MVRKLICTLLLGSCALAADPALATEPTEPYDAPAGSGTVVQDTVVETALWLVRHAGSVLWVGR